MTERYVHPEESIKKATDILARISDSVTHLGKEQNNPS